MRAGFCRIQSAFLSVGNDVNGYPCEHHAAHAQGEGWIVERPLSDGHRLSLGFLSCTSRASRSALRPEQSTEHVRDACRDTASILSERVALRRARGDLEFRGRLVDVVA